MDYRKVAEQIYEKVGKKENLISAAHCATRLRLVIADNNRCDSKAVEEIEGVKGVFFASGQLQIILGTGTVNKVYDEFLQVSGLSAATKAEVKQAAAAQQNVFKRAIKTLGDIFVPIIPAIVASGFLMGIMEALNFMVNNGFMALDTSSSIFVFANLFSNVAYVFLPILIAYSAAKAFGGNPYLGAVIGMLMIHPNLQNAWTVATEGVHIRQSVWFGLYEIDLIGYQGHVIPVIIAVWVMCFIEKKLHKIVPEMFDLFVTPLVSVFVTGYLTYSMIGPLFVVIENGIIDGIQWLIALPLGIGSFIMGALYAPTVVAGIHHMYTIIDVGQLAKYGVTYWLPLASAANLAQGAATLAVAVKTKNARTKSMALPSAFSAFMGITEPAIFGVNMRYFKPFICGCIGGACGALFASITQLGASGTGVTGLFGVLLCLNTPVQYVLMMAVSIGVSFALTWIFGYKDEEPQVQKVSGNAAAAGEPAIEETTPEDVEKVIYAPIQGNVVLRESIPDETFASGVLGDGVGIEPETGEVVAPFDGEISSVAETRHAIGITGPGGMELLIHVGVDTVKMNGDGFTVLVSEGDKVKAGQNLMTFDICKIKAAGYSTTAAVLLTNSDDYQSCNVVKTGMAKQMEKIVTVE
ncbi:PTS beta-glucoside transporter subunit IIBCA [Anaerotruncus sp. 1XD22-93]|nr:PTS beta-glucoside transporter subunit IIBCA [Lachnospiraceae bacterium]NBI74831.1 PTS beta-glucoside transporter subunit IIBCA [Lachnospiraceae bacterium]RKJ95255.1 PTS beta-glucoside transporter subunit IIBCA [Anaerotruncus sp. 1XD22-93]